MHIRPWCWRVKCRRVLELLMWWTFQIILEKYSSCCKFPSCLRITNIFKFNSHLTDPVLQLKYLHKTITSRFFNSSEIATFIVVFLLIIVFSFSLCLMESCCVLRKTFATFWSSNPSEVVLQFTTQLFWAHVLQVTKWCFLSIFQ